MGAERPKDSKEKGAAEMREEHDAWRDGQRVLAMCAVEGCRWRYSGTAADGREAARVHREVAHPELAKKKRAKVSPAQQREAAMLKSEWKRRKFKGEEG